MGSQVIKVVHIISSFFRGGRERQLAMLCKYSDNQKVENSVISFNKIGQGYQYEYNLEDKVIYLSQKSLIKRIFEIIRIVKTINPDVLVSWGGFEAGFAIVAAKWCNIKHINGSIRHGIISFNSKHMWRLAMLHLSKYRMANSKAGLKANYLKNGFLLRNGLEFERFNHSSPPSKDKIHATEKMFNKCEIVFVSVANLVPYKDYFTILGALNQIKKKGIKFSFLIVGEGPLRGPLENYIRQNNLEDCVFLLGRRTDIPNILEISDIYLHSSKGEGCSNSILEALASGLPVIATDTGGTSEIVNKQVGRLFNYKDEVSLQTAIEELTLNPDLRLNMGLAAKKYVLENYSLDAMLNDYYGILTIVNN